MVAFEGASAKDKSSSFGNSSILLFNVCALKAANRQWNNLSPELTREIGKLRFVHPTALLIKNLSFYTLSEELFDENYDARCVLIKEHGYFWSQLAL